MKSDILASLTKEFLVKISAFRTLSNVLSSGSFAAAAELSGLTPSAVGLQMRQLEDYFGRPLFDRSGRISQPTAFAREVAGAVGHTLAVVEGLRAHKSLAISGRVHLGAIPSVQTSVLPLALRLLQQAHAQLEIELLLDDTPGLQAALLAGRIDAAIAVRPRLGGSSRLHWRDLACIPFVLLVPGSTPERSVRHLLLDRPWIAYAPDLTGGRVATQYVRRVCPGKTPSREVKSTDAIVAMVAEGLGISVLPQPRAPLLQAYDVRTVDLGSSAPVRQVSMISRLADQDDRKLMAVSDAFSQAYLAQNKRGT